MVQTENVIKINYEDRFVDVVAAQANGPARDAPLVKYFTEMDEVVDLTYCQFADLMFGAANRFRGELSEVIRDGETGPSSENLTVGYLSGSGKDCLINQMGLMVLNACPLVLSPRNSVDIMIHLLSESGARALIYEESFADRASACQEALPHLKLIKKVVFPEGLVEPAEPPLPLIPNQGMEHIVLILHSSGSTSNPKLVKITNRYILTKVSRSRADPIEAMFLRSPIFTTVPMFHALGLSIIWRVLFRGITVVLPTYAIPPQKLLRQVRACCTASLVILPLQIRQLVELCIESSRKNGWDKLSHVKCIAYSGAALPEYLINTLVEQRLSVCSIYGSTETGIVGVSVCNSTKDNPRALTLYPQIDFSIVDRDKDQCQILFNKHDMGLATGVCPPGSEGYLMGDIVKILKYDEITKALQFEYVGRTNDTLIHISGEKTNPIPMEEVILECSLIKQCVILGTGRLNSCLLVQAKEEVTSTFSTAEILKGVFEKVTKANYSAPNHSRVDKDLIYLIPFNSEKSLPVTAKGNVIRKKSEKLFKDEIDLMYRQFGASLLSDITTNSEDHNDRDTVCGFLSNLFSKLVGIEPALDKSFFSQGLDSLSAVKFTNAIKAYYTKSKVNINVVYEFDTIPRLAEYIYNQIQGNEVQSQTLSSYQQDVEDLIQEYTQYPMGKSPKSNIQHHCSQSNLNVLVTGANGSLGSFIIKCLAQRDDIGKIYGMVRASDNNEAMCRIKDGFYQRRIELSESQWERVQGIAYVSGAPNLGLDQTNYDHTVSSVDIIYHVAWRMDFLQGVQGFRDCIENTRSLLKISAFSPRQPAFHFTSTVGATLPGNVTTTIEETRLSSKLVNVNLCNGYNLSKLVSEVVCCRWAERFGFALDIHRVGQVAGDTVNGAWNVREHVPLLIKGAQVMGIIPEAFVETVSWIPVDTAANAMVELNFSNKNSHLGTINHIVNPQSVPWRTIIDMLKEQGVQCDSVDSSTFINTLRHESRYQDVAVNPIASLTEFFAGVLAKKDSMGVTMSTDHTAHRTPAIKSCPKITAELLSKYLAHWRKSGFIKGPTITR